MVSAQPGQLVHGPFWQEPVRVLSVQAVDTWVWVKVEGLRSHRVWERFLSSDEWAQVRPAPPRNGRGDPERAFLALEGYRVRSAYLFDPLLAVTVSQIDPLPHQIEAVYRAILRNPRVRFLLADDPGAGKTIMAGLVMKELKYRGLVQRTLIVVPGHLREQWRREMQERFNEAFVVVDRGVLNSLLGHNAWQEFNQVITSMDFAKQRDVLESLKDARWDLVIVDEAHKFAAYKYGSQTKRTDRYKLGEVLSPRTHFMLFLTATPHKGDPENFRLLLNLLEPGMFPTVNSIGELSRQNSTHLIFLRRMKEDLRNYDNTPLFPPREVTTVLYQMSDAEKELYDAVTQYVRRHYREAVAEKKHGVGFAMLILQRRMASSVHALLSTLRRRHQRLQESLRLWESFLKRQQEAAFVDEGELRDDLEDAPEEERWQKENEFVESLSTAGSIAQLKDEIAELERLIGLAEKVVESGEETKLAELRKVLESEDVRGKGVKLLIFTESRETMEYLAAQLKSWGLSVTTLHGGMSMEQRLAAENEFRNRAQVMVSTEAGGEGINLQFCWLMVNYDIPWNPNRLEQRIGRIHRYGQRHAVSVYNLVAANTIEGRILKTLDQKLQQIRKALGSDRVFDVLGDIVDYLLDGKSLEDLVVQAIAHPITLDDIVAQIQRKPNDELIRKVQEISLEMLAQRHINLAWVLGESERAKENRLIPEYIERFFLRACEKLKVNVKRRGDRIFQIDWVPAEIRDVSTEFKNRFGEVHTTYRKFTFRKELARDDVEFIAPGHPLLEAVVEKLMALGDEDLRGGACFYDPTRRWDGWLWALEGEIVDGRQEVVGKRLFAVYQPKEGKPIVVNPAVIWDLHPAPPENYRPEQPTAEDPSEVPAPIILALLPEMHAYLSELKSDREKFAEVRQKYALPRLRHLINEQEAKIADLEFRRTRGENVELTLRNEKRELDRLQDQLKALQESLVTETTLSIGRFSVLTVFRVMPMPVDEHTADVMAETPELEVVGLQVAMNHERKHGRSPVDVSLQRLGYDIRSTAPDGTVRYIEVKTRARSGSIALTEHEWLKAKQLGESYWLYVVENAATEPTLWLINNPADRLEPQAQIVQYVFDRWKAAAQIAD
ncbi:RNA polymerase-associated protein RapA [bacterium HR17]|uniref:RNA polymerase-associated protein RapA n=1 Tax=Candidatus Fervidibacter japonicus TaxID=2035412 RepID=A0A2H5XER1_9BACT|nr:RNA polymerase-associated protein RapA [bacterium HR17]